MPSQSPNTLWYLWVFVLFSIGSILCLYRIYSGPYSGSFFAALISAEIHLLFFGIPIFFLGEWMGRKGHPGFERGIGFSVFVLALLSLINALVFRVMSLPLRDGIAMLVGNGWHEMRLQLEASKVPLFFLVSVTVAVPLTLAAAFFFQKQLEKLSQLYRISLRPRLGLAVWLACGLLIPGEQFVSEKKKNPELWHLEQIALPFYVRILPAKTFPAEYPIQVRPFERKDLLAESLAPVSPSGGDSSVFFFMVETLRDDWIDEKTAPQLYAFKKQNISSLFPLAGSNSTHSSWYSAFHSDYAFNWNRFRRFPDSRGAPPLQLFKKAGYKIHVFSKNLDMDYFNTREVVFGTGGNLADRFFLRKAESVATEDELSLQDFSRVVSTKPKGKNLYIFFIDSTHHSYFWPASFDPIFAPFADKFNYLKLNYSQQDIRAIRNRYLNSLAYVDSVFGRAIEAIRKSGVYDKAVIGVVGDHGEEFMEHGAFIHGSNLYSPQTRTGIYFRIPQVGQRLLNFPLSQLNAFPTLLDAVGLYEGAESVLEGRSILRPGLRSTSAVCSEVNGGRIPYAFRLDTSQGSLFWEVQQNAPLTSKRLSIRKITTLDDRPLNLEPEAVKALVEKSFLDSLQNISLFDWK